MESVIRSDGVFFKSIRITLLSIIIFMLAAGNTFSIISHSVSERNQLRMQQAAAEAEAKEPKSVRIEHGRWR